MACCYTVTIRVNDSERKTIRDLAQRLQRSEADAIRVVVREKVLELEALAEKQGASPTRA